MKTQKEYTFKDLARDAIGGLFLAVLAVVIVVEVFALSSP